MTDQYLDLANDYEEVPEQAQVQRPTGGMAPSLLEKLTGVKPNPSNFEEQYDIVSENNVEDLSDIEEPLQPSPDSTHILVHDNSAEVEESAIQTSVPEVAETVEEKEKSTGNLVFEGDDFLTQQLDPTLYTEEQDTLLIPIDEKDLYKVRVSVEVVEGVIKDAFERNARRVSFSLEELGLHNRLIEMGSIPQDYNDFIIIKTEKGNIVVHKTRDSMTEIESQFMKEAKACLSSGQRIVIPLLERYRFKDSLGIISERLRYRASLQEIKKFVARSGMRGTITKDSLLVIYE